MLVITPGFPPARGGIERTAGEVATALRRCEVMVVAGHPPPSPGVGMRPAAGISVRWANNDPPYGRRATMALIRRAIAVGSRVRPDVVLALHIRTMPAARAVARLHGARVLLVVHAKEMRDQPRLARASVSWADAVVTVSGFSRELSLEAGARSEKLRMIHPGVDVRDPPPPLSVRPPPPTVVTVSRMDDEHKGHRVALEVMVRLRELVPDVQWVMIGDGVLRPELERRAADLGIADSVTFPGAVSDDELSAHLDRAHAFCLMSQFPAPGRAGEGFGIVFIEAGARGLPVVAGRVSGVVDAVPDGVTGVLVEPDDVDAAAAALGRLLQDLGYAEHLGAAGRKRAESLAWPLVAERYRQVMLDAVSSAPAGAPSPDWAWIGDILRAPGRHP